MTAEDSKARTRFFIIGIVRLAGALTIALAVAISYGKVDGAPPVLGYGLLLIGVVEMLMVPQMLVRRWKTPTVE